MTCEHVHVGGRCVNICRGPAMEERSREPEEVRWCFRCRKHLLHELVLKVPVEPSYYGASLGIECVGCGGDHADFPGSWRDGPRYSLEVDA